MSYTDNANRDINNRLEELESFCGSNALSLDGLHERIDGLPSSIIRDSVFFHRACINEKVTLEILVCLLGAFPGACDVDSDIFCPEAEEDELEEGHKFSYPLHLVCYNEACSRSMIELVMKENPSALSVFSFLKDGVLGGYDDCFYVPGSPLHYYLTRQSNIDIETVKMIVQAAAPNRILLASDYMCYPIHAALSNPNICDMQDILGYLLEAEPSTIQLNDAYDRVPLQVACYNERMNASMIRFLLNADPEAVLVPGLRGWFPMHTLCANYDLDDASWLDIFQLLVGIDSACVRQTADGDGRIPLHLAVAARSLSSIKALVEAYPESPTVAERGMHGFLPLHKAVERGRSDMVQYFLELYPESIHARDRYGNLPIHLAFYSDWMKSIEMIELLLMHDPTALTKKNDSGRLPLHVKCGNHEMNLNVIQYLYDTFPESILVADEDGKTPLELLFEMRERLSDVHWYLAKSLPVVAFLETQLRYASKAQDMNSTTIADDNGCLQLHLASGNNDTSLGSMKLLVKGNPDALEVPDNNGNLPLHHACRSGNCNVIRYLLEMGNPDALEVPDNNGNLPLHHACLGGNCNVIRYLLEINAASVSKRNGENKLPVQLLLEAVGDSDDCESPEYTDIIWKLLLAYPETVVLA